MARIIPNEAFLLREGLYCHEYTVTMGGLTQTKWALYAAEGYCFYNIQIPENYDEEGNLLPLEDRIFYQYMLMPKNEAYVEANIFVVPVQDGYEIVSVGTNHETI